MSAPNYAIFNTEIVFTQGYRILINRVSATRANVTILDKNYKDDDKPAPDRRFVSQFGQYVPTKYGEEWNATIDKLIEQAELEFSKRFPDEHPPKKYTLTPCVLVPHRRD